MITIGSYIRFHGLVSVFYFVILFAFSGHVLSSELRDLKIGVYYFPGWKNHAETSRPYPWDPISKFPQRKPLLGWYDEGSDDVTKKHLFWMKENGIDYVVYDWYWTKNDVPRLEHAIDSYRRIASLEDPTYAIMWANHTSVPESYEQFDSMVEYWIDNFFGDKRYEKIEGKPIVIIFAPDQLERNAAGFGYLVKDLVSVLREKVRARLGVELFIFGVTHAVNNRVNGKYFNHGYDAYTGYNYHYGVEGVFTGANYSHSYEELDVGYRKTWAWMSGNSKLPYSIPVISGWDRRPWGGSVDPEHDNSRGSAAEFLNHIIAAKNAIFYENKSSVLMRRIHICCWNEFGEGSFIEPTEYDGFDFINAVRLMHEY